MCRHLLQFVFVNLQLICKITKFAETAEETFTKFNFIILNFSLVNLNHEANSLSSHNLFYWLIIKCLCSSVSALGTKMQERMQQRRSPK